MNEIMLAAFAFGEATGIKGVILQLLVMALVILAVWGLIALIEYLFGSIPSALKAGIAIVLVILVLAWAVITFL